MRGRSPRPICMGVPSRRDKAKENTQGAVGSLKFIKAAYCWTHRKAVRQALARASDAPCAAGRASEAHGHKR